MKIKPTSSHKNSLKNFQQYEKMRKSIVKANDAMIHENRTKGIKDLAKRLAKKMQNDGVITVQTNNICGKADSLFSSRTKKLKTELTRENFKKILLKKK